MTFNNTFYYLLSIDWVSIIRCHMFSNIYIDIQYTFYLLMHYQSQKSVHNVYIIYELPIELLCMLYFDNK